MPPTISNSICKICLPYIHGREGGAFWERTFRLKNICWAVHKPLWTRRYSRKTTAAGIQHQLFWFTKCGHQGHHHLFQTAGWHAKDSVFCTVTWYAVYRVVSIKMNGDNVSVTSIIHVIEAPPLWCSWSQNFVLSSLPWRYAVDVCWLLFIDSFQQSK